MSRDGSCPSYYYQPQTGDPSEQPPPTHAAASSSYPYYDQYAACSKPPSAPPVQPGYGDQKYPSDHNPTERSSYPARPNEYWNGADLQSRCQSRPQQPYGSEPDWRGGQQHGSYSSEQPSCHDQYETQVDTVFVQNLPKGCTREDVAEVFGSIGVVKIDKKTGAPKVWIYRDKQTGEGKGEATVTYDDPESANAAIRWFDQKQVLGQTVTVTLAFRKRNTNFQQRARRGRGGRGGDSRSDYYGRNSNDFSGPMRRHGGGRDRNAPY